MNKSASTVITASISRGNINSEPSTSSERDVSPSPAVPAPKRIKLSNNQSSILDHLVRPISLSQQQKINDTVLDVIIMDLRPISVVKDRGFRKSFLFFEPSYVFPSRSTFTNYLLPQRYYQKKEKLRSLLSKAESISLTTDGWTSQNNNSSFISYTAHFITEEWKLCSCLLECGQYDESHTSENLSNELVRVANEWNISEKIVTVTTDNAANVTAAVKKTDWGHIGCFAHKLNLIVQAGLRIPEIEPLRKKVKAVVEFFHKSTKSNNKLISMQKQMNNTTTALKLKNDVSTRRNSTFYMFERFLQIQEPLTATISLLHRPLNFLSVEDWLLLKELISILRPFEQLTNEMSSEKHVTLSKVIIIVRGLKSAIEKVSNEVYTLEGKALLKFFEKDIAKRFASLESNICMSKSAFLDPRFKTKVFSSELNITSATVNLENEVNQLIMSNQQNLPALSSERILSNDLVQKDLIWEDFEKVTQENTKSTSKALLEIRSFLSEELSSRKENPLEWWKKRIEIYPYLSQLAKRYLGIIATSVPSERVFSKAGHLISERRSRLKGENVEKILFLHFNDFL